MKSRQGGLKQIRMAEIQNSKQITMTAKHRISDRTVLVIGTWNFDIVWNLSIVIWDFSTVSGHQQSATRNRRKAQCLTTPVHWPILETLSFLFFYFT